jgi:hypothetical protein
MLNIMSRTGAVGARARAASRYGSGSAILVYVGLILQYSYIFYLSIKNISSRIYLFYSKFCRVRPFFMHISKSASPPPSWSNVIIDNTYSRSRLRPFHYCIDCVPLENGWHHHFIMWKRLRKGAACSVHFGHSILIY